MRDRAQQTHRELGHVSRCLREASQEILENDKVIEDISISQTNGAIEAERAIFNTAVWKLTVDSILDLLSSFPDRRH